MKKKDLKVIQDIQAEAWGRYGDRLFREVEKAPAVKKVANLALNEESDRFTEAERGKIRAALNTGAFDGTRKEEDPEVAKEYEEYVERRIKEEVEKGTLTDPSKANKKAKQYARRSKKHNTRGSGKTEGGNA